MSPMRFLLVDDEAQFVETIAERLRARGFIAACAFTGADALDRLQQADTTDVVVLDVNMPGLGGIEILKAIKARHPLTEVIMLTGHASIDSAIEALKFGAFDYLTKPCGLDDIISKAEQAVERKKGREAKILKIRSKPYISERQREALIARVLER